MAFGSFRTRAERTTGQGARLYSIVLYRLGTNSVADADAIYDLDDKIVFNQATARQKDTKLANAFITDWTVTNAEAVGVNQGVGQPEGHIQSIGNFQTNYTFRGFITRASGDDNSGTNPIITRLLAWGDEVKQNASYVDGRFGVLFGTPSQLSVRPVGTGADRVGLTLRALTTSYMAMFPPAMGFDMTLVRSRSDGT